jgi:hypothetical protein
MGMIDAWIRPSLRVAWRITALSLFAALVGPWILFATIRLVVRTVYAGIQGFRAGKAAAVTHLPCPRGHRSELHGIFECRCGALFAGWAFESCPVCHEGCGYVTCEHCGLAVKNPIVQALEPRRWIP